MQRENELGGMDNYFRVHVHHGGHFIVDDEGAEEVANIAMAKGSSHLYLLHPVSQPILVGELPASGPQQNDSGVFETEENGRPIIDLTCNGPGEDTGPQEHQEETGVHINETENVAQGNEANIVGQGNDESCSGIATYMSHSDLSSQSKPITSHFSHLLTEVRHSTSLSLRVATLIEGHPPISLSKHKQ
ncbi:hypothetical protein RIF29_39742 [Crotalaria pallida]|uniref:Uncharacterized protein n=1 Tax=Crotalaria pallida TaxID=3830 RepID=A0AAN9E4U3_CROPI